MKLIRAIQLGPREGRSVPAGTDADELPTTVTFTCLWHSGRRLGRTHKVAPERRLNVKVLPIPGPAVDFRAVFAWTSFVRAGVPAPGIHRRQTHTLNPLLSPPALESQQVRRTSSGPGNRLLESSNLFRIRVGVAAMRNEEAIPCVGAIVSWDGQIPTRSGRASSTEKSCHDQCMSFPRLPAVTPGQADENCAGLAWPSSTLQLITGARLCEER